jgi:hypothetical protein
MCACSFFPSLEWPPYININGGQNAGKMQKSRNNPTSFVNSGITTPALQSLALCTLYPMKVD